MGIFSALNKIGSSVGNVGIGVAKSVIDLPREFAQLGVNVGDAASRAVTGKKATAQSPFHQGTKETKFTRPTNSAQKVGFAAGQIGQFFVPGVGQEKAVATAAKLASKAGLAKKGISAADKVARLGSEAATQGAVGAVQSGDLKTGADTSAASLALGAAGGVVGKAAGEVAKVLPPRMINVLVKPATKEFEFGRNAGKGVVREGIVATSKPKLLSSLNSKLKELGNEIGKKLDPIKEKIDISPAAKKLDDLIHDANEAGEPDLANAYKQVKNSFTKTFSRETGAEVGERSLQITPKEAQEIKIKIGKNTKWHGQPFDTDKNKARVAVYRTINDLIGDAADGIKDLNARYADILTARQSLQRVINEDNKAKFTRGVIPGGLSSGLAAAGALVSGMGAPQIAGAALTGAALSGAARSTLGRTAGAQAIKATGKALQKDTPGVRGAAAGLTGKALNMSDNEEEAQITSAPQSSTVTEESLLSKYPDLLESIEKALESGIPPEYIDQYIQKNRPAQ